MITKKLTRTIAKIKGMKSALCLLMICLMVIGSAPHNVFASQNATATNSEPRMLSPYVYVDGEPYYVGIRPAIVPRVRLARSAPLPPVDDVFVWSNGTPAGARLVVDGEVVATAPTNPATVFGGTSNPATSFHIEMDNTPANEGQEAKVYLVGVNNQWAGQVWLMQNSVNPAAWQDIVFYIPYVRSSAVFSFVTEEECEEYAALRIIKRSAETNQGLAGATFTVTGPDGFNRTVTTGGNGTVLITGLVPGEYEVTETVPPNGYQLTEPISQTVTVQPGSIETLEVVFVNEPYTNGDNEYSEIIIYKREMSNGIGNNQLLAGATFRLEGFYPGEPPTPIDRTATTGADGRVVFSNLPAGHFTVTEIQPPTGYLLGENNVWTVNLGWGQTEELGTAPSHTFFNIPKSSLEILKICGVTNEPLAGAIFELHDPTTGERWQATTGTDGIAVFGRGSNGNFLYPYRTYIVHEITAPPGFFRMTGPREIVLSPGDENRITFENMPYSEIIIYKREVSNGVGNNQLLAGATFRIEGFYPGDPAMPIDRTATTSADGRVIFTNLPAGHFTITEIQPPTGYLLGENNVWAVNLGWGQTVAAGTAPSHTFFNIPKSSLEILKIDGITNAPLAGAIFELYDPTSGETWQATSGANGIAVFGRGTYGNFLYPYRTYIIREIVAPEGYVLMEGPREIVLSPGNENRITWRNWQNPGLTIIKVCQDTNERLAGAHFTIEAQGSGRPLPTDFPMITDENGEIFIPWTLFEGEAERSFIVTETVPPPGFHLSDPNWQLVTLQAGYDNTVVFRNRRKPTLTILKTDAVTGAPIQGAEFTIERLSPAPAGMITGNPFRTDSQGRIVLPELPAGVYRIIETRAARYYWLDSQIANRTWTITIRENEDYLLQVQNTMLPTLIITKWNHMTHRPVPLTHFRVEFEVPGTGNVIHIGDFVTDVNGQIILPFVQVGWYRITEIRPAPGMSLNTNNSYRVFLNPGQNTYQWLASTIGSAGSNNPLESDAGYPWFPPVDEDVELPNPNPELPPPTPVDDFPYTPQQWESMTETARQAFLRSSLQITGGDVHLHGYGIWNWPLNSIVIKKTCSVTGQLLRGATFELIHTSAGVSGTLGTVIGRYTTDNSGIIVITGLVPGSYVVREVQAPTNFTLSVNNTQTAFLMPDGHSVVELNFANDPYGSLLITKRCEVTNEPLRNAEFRVTTSDGSVVGTSNGVFMTNNQGYILIPNLPPNSYVVTEVRAPDGFLLDNLTKTIRVNATGQTYALHFTNRPLSTLIIRKFDSYDMSPLSGARFEVRRPNGEVIGEFVSNHNGIIEIPRLLGYFIVQEVEAPPGFALDNNPLRTVYVGPRAPTIVTFLNPRNGSLTIIKVDGYGRPLAGADFRVNRQNGEFVGNFTTGTSGMINIPNLTAGFYSVEETRAPQGFVISGSGKTVEVRPNTAAQVTFVNFSYPTLTIVKTDGDGTPLPGAVFQVNQVGGAFNERFTTGAGGVVTATLPPGTFEIVEIQAPPGFVITEAARTIALQPGQHRTEHFVNHRDPSIIIEKVDGEGNPLSGAEFEVRTIPGTLVARVTTAQGGLATVTGLEPGSFQVTEVRAPSGFVLDSRTQTVEVRAGETATLRFVNHRQPSLIIEKVCTDGNPLQGAEFEIRTLGGNLVQRVTTAQGGLATVTGLEPGSFQVTEVRAPSGFVLDSRTQTVEVRAGETATLRFVNHRQPSLIIEKVCTDGSPLQGAEFEIRTLGGNLVQRVTTAIGGMATVTGLEPGSFQVTEVRAPSGFVLDSQTQTVEVRAGETATLRFINHRQPSLIIEKVCTDGNPLQSAEFEVRTLDGSLVHRGTTNHGGILTISPIDPGAFTITETRAPDGFVIDEGSRTVQITAGQTLTERFVNPRLATFTIRKICGDTNRPLQGVVFEISTLAGERIRNPQNNSFEFVTDAAGLIRLPNLPAGTYVATETRALPGYALAEPYIFVVGNDREYIITIRNYKQPSIVIRKICGDTGQPLAGVEFEIAVYLDNGRTGQRLKNYAVDNSYTFTTDRSGHIYLPTLPDGRYVAIETRPLPGFMVAQPTIFTVGVNGDLTVIIRNYRYPDFAILKLDGDTRQPLQGVHFEIAHDLGNGQAGQRLVNPADNTTTFITDAAGRINLPGIAPGRYIAIETRALPGYVVEGPTIFTIEAGQNRTITVYNFKRADWVIRKRDGDTREPLAGVHFEIARYFGNGNAGERLRNPIDGSNTFITDSAGLIQLPNLEAGTFIAIETRALPGFIVAEPRIFVVGADAQNTTIDIYNYRRPNLTIRKINSYTRQSIEGVAFEISRLNGERVRNPQTGFFEFLTDRNGLIHLPDIEDGTFIVTETRPAPGFIGLTDPIILEINAAARQREYLLVVENDPASGLLIIKTCAQTNEPLQGVEFEIRHADGRLVTGQILDGNQPNTHANSPQLGVDGNGRFLTDARGRIQLNHLPPGVYHITETRALPGYQLDTTVHVVTVLPGQQAVLRVENAPLAGFRLLKICSVTRNPIFNVEFMVFDSNNQVVGVFTTDNNGLIDFSAILAPGRYTIRETRPAPGFSRDDVPRTVEFVAGRVLEIVWENVPIAGQLQILKVSGDANYHNGLPAGTPLEGAIFEIFEARTGNLVDRIISNERGMAVSRPLPLGRYIAVEVAAPAFYMINPQEIHFEIEFEGQIVRTTFPNFSANVGVTIRKTGPQEAMQGHNIRYEIPIIRNDSTVPLADFFWRDILPTNAVRVDRLVTGTFNHALRYRVLATTNRGNEIVVADNLSTTRNNVIELRPVHLGLAADEYVVEFIVHFGQVPAGFSSVERPRVYVDVLPAHMAHLPNGMMFANRVDVGGRIIGTTEWVIGNSTTATTIFNPNPPPRRIPQSGW